MPPLRDATIRLGDGRALAYAEWGDRQGAPVLLFHGTPMSRLWCPDENVTAASRVRLLTIDRPGIGRSDVLPRRTFGDWPGDVAEFGDVLGIDEFGVVGWSAGGPYAAACAARIPDRLTGVAIGACRALSRFNFAENPAAREELPADDRRLFELAQQDPEAAARAAAEADQEWVRALWDDAEGWLNAAELPPAFLEAVRESVRQGPEAFAWEQIDAFLPWGFRLLDIAIEVHVYDYRVAFIRDCLQARGTLAHASTRQPVPPAAGHEG
jgi:pimeloyl-ACP methyl ester carboxylesterase